MPLWTRESPAAPASGTERELADLTQRYDMAVRDIRELKKQNEELAKKVAIGPRVVAVPGQPLDWEARKRQLLESLEQDDDEQDDSRRAERVQIENVILATDSMVREKQEEIDELKQRLAGQGEGPEGASVARVEQAPTVDSHELVRAARSPQLEAEWEQKLRQAEIDISLQRAQLARTRAEIDERQRTSRRAWRPARSAHGERPGRQIQESPAWSLAIEIGSARRRKIEPRRQSRLRSALALES